MMSEGPEPDAITTNGAASVDEFSLPMLLSKVLLAFAVQFERNSGQSLAIASNALRSTGEEGIRVQDLPRLSGVSKASIAMAVKRLEQRGFAVVQRSEQNRRAKLLVLTDKGKDARNTYRRLVWEVEELWTAEFGPPVRKVRQSLERLADGSRSLLYAGVEPYPDGWRAVLSKPEVLPHYPMVLHRGGFPDGS